MSLILKPYTFIPFWPFFELGISLEAENNCRFVKQKEFILSAGLSKIKYQHSSFI